MKISIRGSFKNKFVIVCLLIFNSNINAQESNRIWQEIGPTEPAYNSIKALGVSLNHPETLYLATDVLLKSTDSGITWNAVKQKKGGFTEVKGEQLLVDPDDPKIIIATTQEPDYALSKVSRSTDGGESWEFLELGFPIYEDSIFRLTGKNLKSLVVQSYSGIEPNKENYLARSYDGGESWVKSETLLSSIEGRGALIVAIDPENPDIMYGVPVGTSTTVSRPLHKTINAGKSWVKIHPKNIDEEGIFRIHTHPAEGRILFATLLGVNDGSSHFIRSDNEGLTWNLLGIPGKQFTLGGRLYLDPADTDILYANVSDSNTLENKLHESLFAKSTDAGKTWQIEHTGFFSTSRIGSNSPIIIHPQDNQKLVWANSSAGVISSINGGKNWQALNVGIKRFGGNLTVAKDDPSTMYLVNNGWGRGFNYFKTTDGGKHWEKFITPELDSLYRSYCQAFILNPVDSRDIWCHNYEGSGLYRSTNSGINWTQLSEPETELSHPIVYANDGKTIYIPALPLLKRSIDNGENWTSLSPRSSLRPVVIDPKDANIIYTIEWQGASNSVYKSEDGGINWMKQIGAINSVFDLYLIISDSQSGKLIFIDGNIINLTVDGGRSWKTLPSPFQGSLGLRAEAKSIAFNPSNPEGLFLVTHKGVFETKNLGESWVLVKAYEPDISIEVVSGEVYLSSSTNIYKLKEPRLSSTTTNCLFDWATQQYPNSFSPPTAQSQFFGEYIYRYYSETNTYLGFFQNTKVHLLQPTISDKIKDVGFIQHYLNLSHCESK